MCCWLGSYSLESILRAAHFLCTTHILVGKQKDWIQGRRVDVDANRVAKDSQLLRIAAQNGQTATVVKLVQECGADVGAADKNGHGDTPLQRLEHAGRHCMQSPGKQREPSGAQHAKD